MRWLVRSMGRMSSSSPWETNTGGRCAEYPPPADLDTLARVIPLLCVSRAVQHLPITREFSTALIDGVVLPALRGG